MDLPKKIRFIDDAEYISYLGDTIEEATKLFLEVLDAVGKQGLSFNLSEETVIRLNDFVAEHEITSDSDFDDIPF